MTATAEATDLDIDLDAVVPCESRREDCDRPAQWIGTSVCCGLASTSCTHHKARHEMGCVMVQARPGFKGFHCTACGVNHRTDPITWRPL